MSDRKKVPARALWMHARCAYIHELLAEGDSLESIARTLSCDPGQVQLLGMTDPDSILEPWKRNTMPGRKVCLCVSRKHKPMPECPDCGGLGTVPHE